MQTIVTNDDGILSEGLWALVRELKKISRVTVVAPDREQSAIGTAVTLLKPLRIKTVKPLVAGAESFSIDGTPSDAVILALGKLARGKTDVVISGINHGPNLGEDVHISGTVSAALQAYLRGVPSLAISAPEGREDLLETAARVAAALARRIAAGSPPGRLLLNVNIPDLPLDEVGVVKATWLARESHINTVEEGDRGRFTYYWLVRERVGGAGDSRTDMSAVERGEIAVTPLYYNRADRPSGEYVNGLCDGLLDELRRG